jgi:hypothetical protein
MDEKKMVEERERTRIGEGKKGKGRIKRTKYLKSAM